MPAYKYFIIGGGLTGDAACRGIRSIDPSGSIGMISQEIHPPYSRPALSKGLWRKKKIDRIWQNTAALGVDIHLGRTITELDLANKRAMDDQKTVYTFEKLLLATGGSPRRLPFGNDDIVYFRTLVDYERLRKLSDERQNFVVIGGGFIGSEIAAALAMHNKKVTIIFPEEGIGGRVFPQTMSIFLNDYYRQKGVEVLPGSRITGIETSGGTTIVKIHDLGRGVDHEVTTDVVVAGVGIQPHLELPKAAGLEVDNGIVVDENLLTNHPDVYAAGDVASFYSKALKQRMRVEHEDNAQTMGMLAGKNMAGEHLSYHHLPFFYSDLFDLGYEAVGELNAQKEIVAEWKEMYQKGILYYMSGSQVRGVLLWNVWSQVENARRVIEDPGPFTPTDLLNKIPM
jgi:3-phenylpropionate/trans-cinnamate dioxygenase ferredoxin reductase component